MKIYTFSVRFYAHVWYSFEASGMCVAENITEARDLVLHEIYCQRGFDPDSVTDRDYDEAERAAIRAEFDPQFPDCLTEQEIESTCFVAIKED